MQPAIVTPTVTTSLGFRDNHTSGKLNSTEESSIAIAIDPEVTKAEFRRSSHTKPEHQCYPQKPKISLHVIYHNFQWA